MPSWCSGAKERQMLEKRRTRVGRQHGNYRFNGQVHNMTSDRWGVDARERTSSSSLQHGDMFIRYLPRHFVGSCPEVWSLPRIPAERPEDLSLRKSCMLTVERVACFRGLTKPLNRSFVHSSIDGRVSHEVHQPVSTWPGTPSVWTLAAQGSGQEAKEMAC